MMALRSHGRSNASWRYLICSGGLCFFVEARFCYPLRAAPANPDFLLGGRTSASAECRHWSGRAVRWSSCTICLEGRFPWMRRAYRRFSALAATALAGSTRLRTADHLHQIATVPMNSVIDASAAASSMKIFNIAGLPWDTSSGLSNLGCRQSFRSETAAFKKSAPVQLTFG